MTQADFDTDDPLVRSISAGPRGPIASLERRSDLVGNFGDFENLFEQLGRPPVIELGNPLPKAEYMPKKRAGSCPAAHNRALLKDCD